MGYCRRCGDIVSGPRCKCGGTPVVPVIPFYQLDAKGQPEDRWSKTYVSRERSPTRSATLIATHTTGSRTSPTKFPRPANSVSRVVLGSRVSAHIATTTSQSARPPSPLKKHITGPAPEDGILPSLSSRDSTLSKVYGSVLQLKETLAKHACAICNSPFPPDSTIYPDPTAAEGSSPRFLCRSCFTDNGGCKGQCPGCGKDVMALKSEGDYIHAVGSVWHKRCFVCNGCGINVGDSPLVDLLGRPSCSDCFDSCLNRDGTPRKRHDSVSTYSRNTTPLKNRTSISESIRSRKNSIDSPALEELEQRLGITRSPSSKREAPLKRGGSPGKREASPALEELTQRLNMIGKDSPGRGSPRYSKSREGSPFPAFGTDSPRTSIDSPNGSPRRGYERFDSPGGPSLRSQTTGIPIRRQRTGSVPTEEAIEEMKKRFMNSVTSSPASTPVKVRPSEERSSGTRTPSRTRAMSKSTSPTTTDSPSTIESSVPSTPDLVSDCLASPDPAILSSPDPTLLSSLSGLDSPANFAADLSGVQKGGFFDRFDESIIEESNSQLTTPTKTPQRNDRAATKSKADTPIRRESTSTRTTPVRARAMTTPSRTSDSPSTGKDKDTNIPTHCAKCHGTLFAIKDSGRYVVVPDEDSGQSHTYHNYCLSCSVCGGSFRDVVGGRGKAVYVKAEGGPCHPECAPREKITVHTVATPNMGAAMVFSRGSTPSKPSSISNSRPQTPYSSSRYESSPLTAPATSTTFPRFGSSAACPGCHKNVSPMERGVVSGPQNSKWHATCLVCGGKKETPKWGVRGRDGRKKGEPGCGKKLDSAAKVSEDGKVWCRECMVLLLSPAQRSPERPQVILPQLTGTTTIARQFTGMGAAPGDGALMRQMTSGGSGPMRQRSISPTKGMRPRPKSVIGMRGKSVDEGRGMFLVRQMTGGGTSGGL
ncbi:hypothetical protein FISHEDRAFT_49364 [Fistulina hepatica ATCC 64428]|uniref:LIM zinc-binding domain-containing protein n=1 Tax=Fistulina hepatica ATCC 64428 TaxID=1128425 RepID=A0A0D7A3Z7_9AGAR|nr:hypothetical protein FISHEDRAFT_49364 [Fistulina hepatica ATCC 64428]